MPISDSEFWYNTYSIVVYLFNEFLNLTISRCLFQGRKGTFNVTSWDRKTTAVVYVHSTVLKELPKMYHYRFHFPRAWSRGQWLRFLGENSARFQLWKFDIIEHIVYK